MNIQTNSRARLLTAAFAFVSVVSLCGVMLFVSSRASCACGEDLQAQDATAMAQGEKKVDKRKLTTIQTASVDVGEMKKAVEVRYLDLPWGKATFGYIETGIDPMNGNYYAKRTWPIAHLRLAAPAKFQGQTLPPGDYAMIITPKNPETKAKMKLSLASFKPAAAGGTFLVPGDVFVESPQDAVVVAEKEIAFGEGAPLVEQLSIWAGKEGKTVSLKIHYGDRTLTEKLTLQ